MVITKKISGVRCAVNICGNIRMLTKNSPTRKFIKYHKLPKSPGRRQKWVKKIKLPPDMNSNYATVCSEHFTTADYIRDYAVPEEVSFQEKKKGLIKSAIPSNYLDASLESPQTLHASPGQSKRAKRQRSSVMGDEITSAMATNNANTVVTLLPEYLTIVQSPKKSCVVNLFPPEDSLSQTSSPSNTLPPPAMLSPCCRQICADDQKKVHGTDDSYTKSHVNYENTAAQSSPPRSRSSPTLDVECKKGRSPRTLTPLIQRHTHSEDRSNRPAAPSSPPRSRSTSMGDVDSMGNRSPRTVTPKIDRCFASNEAVSSPKRSRTTPTRSKDSSVGRSPLTGGTRRQQRNVVQSDCCANGSNEDSSISSAYVTHVEERESRSRIKLNNQRTANAYISPIRVIAYPHIHGEIKSNKYKMLYEKLKLENTSLIDQVAGLRLLNTQLRTKCKRMETECSRNKKLVNEFMKEIKVLKKKNKSLEKQKEEAEKLLNKLFTKSQVRILKNKQKHAHWDNETISLAFTLRYLSKKCYIYLRSTLNYPLPSISSLCKWASKLNFAPGLLNSVFDIMKTAGEDKTQLQKIAILQFDEIKCKEVYEYYAPNDEIIGPHKQLQVVQARALFDKWKQPVFMDYDKPMTADIFWDIVKKVHDAGYIVVGCVSDNGPGNQGFWKSLGVSHDKTTVKNPYNPDIDIHFFSDSPHALKLNRNWLFDNGFILDDGTVIDKEVIDALFKMVDGDELTSLFDLSPDTVDCEGTMRQCVPLAAKIYSHKVATAIRKYNPLNYPPDKLEKVASFFDLINDWFDIMNSYKSHVNVYDGMYEGGYGQDIEKQNKRLDEIYKEIKNMRARGKKEIQVFQKGILMSINSLRSLYNQLKSKYAIKYILTHRLNQDALENLFSQIRTRGGMNDHPSPVEALYRLRMLMLGRSADSLKLKTNFIEKESTDMLITTTVHSVVPKVKDIVNLELFKGDNELFNEENDTNLCGLEVDDNLEKNLIQSQANELQLSVTQEDGLVYIAGWVARKFINQYPDIGYKTKQLKVPRNDLVPTWIRHLSYGGLIEPSPSFYEKIKALENQFLKFHGSEQLPVRRGPNVTNDFILSMEPLGIPVQILKKFTRLRTFIRIRYLNSLFIKLKVDLKKQKIIDKENREIEKKRKQEEKTRKQNEKNCKQQEKSNKNKQIKNNKLKNITNKVSIKPAKKIKSNAAATCPENKKGKKNIETATVQTRKRKIKEKDCIQVERKRAKKIDKYCR